MTQLNLFKKIRLVKQTARRVKPDVVWVASTRETLLMQVKNTIPVQALAKRSVLKEKLRLVSQSLAFGKWLKTPAMAAVAVLLALFGGSLLSVSAAEKSLPGDLLYSVKLATEQARIALAKDTQEKVMLKTEFTGRRVDEMKQVLADGTSDRKDKVIQTAETLKRDMHTLKQQLGEMQDQSSPEVVKQTVQMVDAKTNAVVQALQDSKHSMSPEEKAKVTEAQAAASDTSVKAIEVLADTHKADASVVTDQDVADALKTHSDTVAKTMAQTVGIDPSSVTSTNALTVPATTTAMTSTTIATLQQVTEAKKSLTEADKLVSENKIDEALQKMKIGTQQAFAAQKTADDADVALANGQPAITAETGTDLPSATGTAMTGATASSSSAPLSSPKPTTTDKILNSSNQTNTSTNSP